MKTLIVYYSLTGETEIIARSLQQTCCAERLELRQTRGYSLAGAYLFGVMRARKGTGSSLRPLDTDISSFGRIILAGPVWARCPAPALTGFLRSYDLANREIHGLLTYTSNSGDSSARFRRDAENAGAVCASVTTLKTSPHVISQLESGNSELFLEPDGGIAFRDASGQPL